MRSTDHQKPENPNLQFSGHDCNHNSQQFDTSGLRDNGIPLSHITEENIYRSNSKSGAVFNSRETPLIESRVSQNKGINDSKPPMITLSLPNDVDPHESMQMIDDNQIPVVSKIAENSNSVNFVNRPGYLLYDGPIRDFGEKLRFCDQKALDVLDLNQIKSINTSNGLLNLRESQPLMSTSSSHLKINSNLINHSLDLKAEQAKNLHASKHLAPHTSSTQKYNMGNKKTIIIRRQNSPPITTQPHTGSKISTNEVVRSKRVITIQKPNRRFSQIETGNLGTRYTSPSVRTVSRSRVVHNGGKELPGTNVHPVKKVVSRKVNGGLVTPMKVSPNGGSARYIATCSGTNPHLALHPSNNPHIRAQKTYTSVEKSIPIYSQNKYSN